MPLLKTKRKLASSSGLLQDLQNSHRTAMVDMLQALDSTRDDDDEGSETEAEEDWEDRGQNTGGRWLRQGRPCLFPGIHIRLSLRQNGRTEAEEN